MGVRVIKKNTFFRIECLDLEVDGVLKFYANPKIFRVMVLNMVFWYYIENSC